MADLALYLSVTIIGYFIGSRVRDKREKIKWTGKLQLLSLIILVLFMGMRMGANSQVTDNLKSIGVTALIMTLVILAFSLGAVTITRKIMKMDRYGELLSNKGVDISETIKTEEKTMEGKSEKGINTMTVAILVSVAVGMAVGFFIIKRLFADTMDTIDFSLGIGIRVGLCLLLALVGMDLGIEGTVVENFKKVGLRILAFPIAIIIGSLCGALVCSLFIPLSAKECLAVGAGLGWYTLAPGMIMEGGYVTASAVSFLHNVMREMLSILIIPLVAEKIGYLETIALPGAASMDVCLPIVEKSTRSEMAVYSFVSGVVLSIAVPIMVPLIVG